MTQFTALIRWQQPEWKVPSKTEIAFSQMLALRSLSSGIQAYQILTNEYEVCTSSLSSILLAVIRGLHMFSIECSPCYAPCQILNSRSEKYPKDYHLGFWWAATHYGCQGNVAKLRLKVYLVENRVNAVG